MSEEERLPRDDAMGIRGLLSYPLMENWGSVIAFPLDRLSCFFGLWMALGMGALPCYYRFDQAHVWRRTTRALRFAILRMQRLYGRRAGATTPGTSSGLQPNA
jgi:hypothetical protein